MERQAMRLVVGGALAGFALCAMARAEDTPAPKTTFLKVGRLLDVRAGRYLTDQGVLIEGERIKEVGSAGAVQAHAPKDARVIDLSSTTLLPGLIDCHAHLLSSMRPGISGGDNILLTVAGMTPAARALLGAANARETLEAGITSVRVLGHSGVDGDAALRDAVNAGWIPGPRILAATRKITPPGGQGGSLRHEVAPLLNDLEFLPVSGPEEARRAVREALFAGADVIKVVMDVEARVLALDEIKAIVEEAHRSKLKVAAHATTALGIEAAVDAGVDSVEHGDEVSDESLAAMAAKGIVLGATDWSPEIVHEIFIKSRILSKEERAAWDAEIKTWLDQTAGRMRRARKAGVRFVMASDMWYRYPGKTRGQAALLVLEGLQAEGVPPAEILRAATLHGAELIGWQDRVGSVDAGKLADLVAVDGDPLKDVKDVQKVSFVMKGGAVVRDSRRP